MSKPGGICASSIPAIRKNQKTEELVYSAFYHIFPGLDEVPLRECINGRGSPPVLVLFDATRALSMLLWEVPLRSQERRLLP